MKIPALSLLFALLLLTACQTAVLPTPAAPAELPTATPAPTALPTATAVATPQIVEIRGEGGDVAQLTVPTAGNVYFASGHFGTGNFFVSIENRETGQLLGVAANCIDNCDDKRTVALKAGTYTLDVLASARWAIFVELP